MALLMPTKILIIRHAEKPIPGTSVGIRASGKEDAASLSVHGWQRAGALVQMFENLAPGRPGITRPDHLFGARYDRYSLDASRRSLQTLKPLARSMGMRIANEFGKGQEKKLVSAVSKLSGTVLIAWAHEDIGAIAQALHPVNGPVPPWQDDRYDRVWVFDETPRGWNFTEVLQWLMAGDAS